jgi:hypothetical protein
MEDSTRFSGGITKGPISVSSIGPVLSSGEGAGSFSTASCGRAGRESWGAGRAGSGGLDEGELAAGVGSVTPRLVFGSPVRGILSFRSRFLVDNALT